MRRRSCRRSGSRGRRPPDRGRCRPVGSRRRASSTCRLVACGDVRKDLAGADTSQPAALEFHRQRLVAGPQRSCLVDERIRHFPSPSSPVPIPRLAKRRDPQRRQAALAQAEQFALAAQLEVQLGQLEAVVVRRQRIEPGPGGLVNESETRMQYDCASPRPTRPRSWWS